jgi:hypothetical protein
LQDTEIFNFQPVPEISRKIVSKYFQLSQRMTGADEGCSNSLDKCPRNENPAGWNKDEHDLISDIFQLAKSRTIEGCVKDGGNNLRYTPQRISEQ